MSATSSTRLGTTKLGQIILAVVLCNVVLVGQAQAWIVSATWERFAVGSSGGDQNLGQGDGLYNGNSRTSVVTAYAHSGTKSLQVFLPRAANDTWQHEYHLPSSITEGGELWARFYVYPPSGFDWTCSPISKLFRVAIVDAAGGFGYGFISILTTRATNYGCSSATPNDYGYIVGGAEMLSSYGFVCQNRNSSDDYLTPGVWHALELYIKVSANAAGVFRMWHQGKLIWEKTGISNIPPGGALWAGNGMATGHFLGYWNGGVPNDEYLYFDDFTYTNQTPANVDAAGNPMIGLVDYLIFRDGFE